MCRCNVGDTRSCALARVAAQAVMAAAAAEAEGEAASAALAVAVAAAAAVAATAAEEVAVAGLAGMAAAMANQHEPTQRAPRSSRRPYQHTTNLEPSAPPNLSRMGSSPQSRTS